MQKLTIKKIAELAGVSKATVSRVLNDYPYISEEIRDRVMTVVNETGYKRNQIARMLASDRSNVIGLVIRSGTEAVFTDPYFPHLTRGVSIAASQNSQTLALFLCESEQEGEETIKSILASGVLDGIVITADYKNNTLESLLNHSDLPHVFVGKPQTHANVSFIDTDNFQGGYIATEYLIQRGYKRIAVIGSYKNTSGDDRYNGYCHALESHGIAHDDALAAFGNYSMDSGTKAMYALLPAKPDAVFVASDTMALGAIRAMREHNLRIPDDIAIIGYDDLPPAVQADPQLTTIRQPITQTGELAVDTLLKLIEQPEQPPYQVFLPVELVVRTSTA